MLGTNTPVFSLSDANDLVNHLMIRDHEGFSILDQLLEAADTNVEAGAVASGSPLLLLYSSFTSLNGMISIGGVTAQSGLRQ
ncbi:hypothetical protein DENIT_12978 [Pseudomonas veronii]|nr:hypothetical protein DENIT_12978 [Pseudomonas veronii]